MQSHNAARYKEVLGHFATGVTVITGCYLSKDYGFTCQSFMALSLDPQLVLFAASKSSTSFPAIRDCGYCCINILSLGQESIARTFSISGANKFNGLGYTRGLNGSPKINDCLAWIEAKLHDVREVGDHYVVVCEVLELSLGQGKPLIYYRGGFGGFEV
jgi:3-hydroxy-9,10-secoandrosta-1,3,5(10)-triene-9,17-dione monooxygenase reductase component